MKNILLILTVALALLSCKKKDDETSYPHADWVTATYTKSSEKQTFYANITSYDVEWRIAPIEKWCSAEPLSGNESASIDITIEANTDTQPREGRLEVICMVNGSEQRDTLIIKQESEPWAINFSPQGLEVTSDAGSEIVEMELNRPYLIENIADYPWLTVTEAPATYLMAKKTLKIDYTQNTAIEFRRADLRFAIPDTTIVTTFTVYQFGTGSRSSDSLALVKLYNDCGGLSWKKQWTLTDPMTKWHGVELGKSPNGMRVTSLNLTENGLTGSLPAEICNLSYLRNLWLGGNELSGSIPADMDRLQIAEYIYLYDNKFTGTIPPAFGNISSLTRLHLYGNELSGTIPEEIGNLANLTALGLMNNNLTGSLPEAIGSLSGLKELSVKGNRLTGAIPETYGKNANYFGWEVEVNVCPQQEGYGFDNCK